MKLNLGPGALFLSGWENLDYEVPVGYEKYIKKVDITQGLPYPDESVELIYCAHVFDHIAPILDGVPLLVECRRVMQPGAVARFTMMDWNKIAPKYPNHLDDFAIWQPDFYRRVKSPALKFSLFLFGDSGSKQSMGYKGHWACLNYEAFKELAMDAGWEAGQVFNMEVQKSHSKTLERDVKDMYEDHSFFVELVK